jgi:hypothetical protein
MARDFAISYGSNARPAGQPAGNVREVRPERHAVGRDRNVSRINPTPTHDPRGSKCLSMIRDGSPCQAPPKGGTDLCVFHTPRDGYDPKVQV